MNFDSDALTLRRGSGTLQCNCLIVPFDLAHHVGGGGGGGGGYTLPEHDQALISFVLVERLSSFGV